MLGVEAQANLRQAQRSTFELSGPAADIDLRSRRFGVFVNDEIVLAQGLRGVLGARVERIAALTQGAEDCPGRKVEAVKARLAQVEGRQARVRGTVIIGSYAFEDASKTHRFNLQEQGDVMQVAYRGPLPDVFKEGMPVVVEGVVRGDMSIEAREVTAKCPSKS